VPRRKKKRKEKKKQAGHSPERAAGEDAAPPIRPHHTAHETKGFFVEGFFPWNWLLVKLRNRA